MKYIKDYKEGDRMGDIYLIKQKTPATTKAGKAYENVIIQDRTGTMDGKIWDVQSAGIEDFEAFDYVHIYGDVTSFQGSLQVSIKRAHKASKGEYDPAEYVPVSRRDNDEMYKELLGIIDSVREPHLNRLLTIIFKEKEAFVKAFRESSAAKAVHHGFMGGLMEHTLSVAALCDFYCKNYGEILNRDLLITAALCHDLGKVSELSPFPQNDYTDEGQLIGHIVEGCELIGRVGKSIDGFPPVLLRELRHCILAHHGELEYGSPKKPALIEALALNFADNTDAKIETFREVLENNSSMEDWMGYNRLFDSALRKTRI